MKSILAILLLLVAATVYADATSAPQAAAAAAATNVHEVLRDQAAAPEQHPEFQPLQLLPQARSAVEHFTLGAKTEGAVPIFSYSNTINYDAPQEIVAEVSYPEAAALVDDTALPTDAIITQIEAYVEGSDGMECQAYVLGGGIGEKSVTLQFVASNTESLRYVVVVNGNKL